jgi:L-lactate dehydrogenase complex protein LldE
MEKGRMTDAAAKPERVYYFGTCLADMLYPETGMAGIRLIEREGVSVVYPQAQSCCGQPAYNTGYFDEARAVARKQLEIFSADYPIVVPSGSCAGMLKYHYLELFEGQPEYGAVQQFAGRIFELSEFLLRVLDIDLTDRGEPIRVTWHSSCHHRREMKTTEDSKALIRRLRNVELIELEREHECCGFGGTFAVKHPQISAAMAHDKISDIQASGASRLITGDCGCLMNISGVMSKQAIPISGQHLAEFLWERTNGQAAV